MNGFEVAYDALAHGARGHDALAAETRSAQRALAGARLPEGALGKLPQSQEIAATFAGQYTAVETGLDGLVRAFEQISTGLGLTIETYRDGDTAVADAFRVGER
ncbi:MAG: hypothetical protein NVV70_12535 [Cellulomonas sp.]|uniref:hypothetical protein n=1 Tax=unclassified Cellulomonas TaxID=2620175 RepID=UPI0006526FAB|nr:MULTISPECIES: hypothetical protein [unclassified Cellulomonas]KMM44369.1 hypothetical protein CWIS_16840 [Cellulomonas sp. A375-1]MCR6648914.1 hypothetical protein [Cellulomonas sp.]MCR6704897.1 hypothetical protein [Cellulomonas sp.]